MKRTLSLFLAVVLILSLAACGGNTTATTETQTSTTTTETTQTQSAGSDTLTFAYSSGPSVLDPVMVPGDNATLYLTDLLFGTLMRPTTDGSELYPYLADSYTVSEDGLVYTFALKQGVKFSDGTDVTVDDWVFSLLRARDTEESNWAVSVENIADVKALDDKTLEITLKAATESFLADMSMFNTAVQSKAYIEKVGEEENQIHPMGTGAFMVTDWEIGSYINMAKNPYYFDADKVKLNTIRFNIVPDAANRILQLQSGEADIIDSIPFNNIAELDAMDGISAMGVTSSETQFLCMNYKNEKLKDIRVRQALRYATDCQQIVDLVLAGFGETGTSYISSSGQYYNKNIAKPEYNVEKAKQLLAEAGYPNGFEVTCITRPDRATMEEVAVILKEQWAQVGVTLNIESVEKSMYIEKRNAADFEISPISWVDDIPHPSQVSEHWFDYSKEMGYFCDYNNKVAFDTLQKALVELDPAKCAELYGQLQQIWYDDIPGLCLYYAQIPVALRDCVKGFEQTSMGRYRLENCYKEAE